MTRVVTLDTRVSIRADVLARAVGDETVLLDLASGTYFGLDPVGSRVWTLIGRGRSPAEVCDELVHEYDVPRETLERDVLDLVGQLCEKNLIDAAPS